jgi:D-alanyl-D-alanine dipeptidase
MIKEGFETDEDEWWHFDFGNQKWAVQTTKTEALYGEVKDPMQFLSNLKQE